MTVALGHSFFFSVSRGIADMFASSTEQMKEQRLAEQKYRMDKESATQLRWERDQELRKQEREEDARVRKEEREALREEREVERQERREAAAEAKEIRDHEFRMLQLHMKKDSRSN